MSRKLLVALVLPLLLASSLAWAQDAAAPDETTAEPRQPMQWGLFVGFVSGGVVSEADFDTGSPAKERDSQGLSPEIEDIKEIGGIWAIALSKRTWFQVRVAVGETTYYDTPNGRVARLMDRHPEIVELDLNPLLLYPEAERAAAVDARIRVAEPPEAAR